MDVLMDTDSFSALSTPGFEYNFHQHHAFGSPTPPLHLDHQASASALTLVPNFIDPRLHEVLACLSQIKIIGRLVRRWLQVCINCPIPKSLLLDLLVSIESAAHCCNTGKGDAPAADGEFSQLAENVQDASSHPLIVPRGSLPAELCQLLTGQNLRAESIGLILSVAGNAVHGLLDSDVVFAFTGVYQDILDRNAFTRGMLSASDAAIAFAKEQYKDPHDVILWLRYENFVLTKNCCGYESENQA
jgi:hypothetical protein